VNEPRRARTERQLTAQGEATRQRIITTSADLFYRQGVAATPLSQLVAINRISKSQFYHYFEDKDELVEEVIGLQARYVLRAQGDALTGVATPDDLEQWASDLVEAHRGGQRPYGCPIGSLASEVAGHSRKQRRLLAEAFEGWVGLLTGALARMAENECLDAETDLAELATSVIAAVQGGYLLAQAAHDSEPFGLAVAMAVQHVRTFAR
jgi:TetR/AcrR family transcriptional regulator, transcriptional repressor for nem operon